MIPPRPPAPRRSSPRKSGSIRPPSSSVPAVPKTTRPNSNSFQVSSIEEVKVNKCFKVVLSGPPKAQQRPRIGNSSRSSLVNGKIITHPVIYNPSQKEQRKMKEVIKQVIQPHIHASNQDVLFKDPVSIKAVIKFFLPRPECHFRRGRSRSVTNVIEKKTKKHIGKPDLDNLLKFVLDAMEGVVYKNDSHITSIKTTKSYDTIGACHGRILINLTEMPKDCQDYDNHEIIVIEE
jgi:Holliday junction resolvase